MAVILDTARSILQRLFASEPAYLEDEASNTKPKKRVVILGAGYAGTAVAKALDGTKGIEIVVVSLHDGFVVHKVGALRAAVRADNW